VQITVRDEAMLEWLQVVRLADMDAIRWAMGSMSGLAGPVGARAAQLWVARLREIRYVDRARPRFGNGSIVWPTTRGGAGEAPDLFRQTTRHEVAVAAVSARYLAHGYTWAPDRKPRSAFEHQADGVAVKGDTVELVEVELSAKTAWRYKQIHESHAMRIAREGIARVAYLCTPDAARVVAREADKYIFRTERPRLVTVNVFDRHGKWVSPDLSLWDTDPVPSATGKIALDGLGNLQDLRS
jgi:hypothetical protein